MHLTSYGNKSILKLMIGLISSQHSKRIISTKNKNKSTGIQGLPAQKLISLKQNGVSCVENYAVEKHYIKPAKGKCLWGTNLI